MPISFEDLIRIRQLNKDTDFNTLAQAAIVAHYLIPYPGKEDLYPYQVNRNLHGGVHVSMVASNIDLLLELYGEYDSEALKMPDGKPINIKLLKLAAIYHDSKNTSETVGNEIDHANALRRDMMSLGYTAEEIEPYALAIQYKSGKESTPLAGVETILQKILEDADRLDVIRSVGPSFDIGQMGILKHMYAQKAKLSSKLELFEKELKAIVEQHQRTVKIFYTGFEAGALQKYCEFSSDCYQSVRKVLMDQLLQYVVLECLKQGKMITHDEIDISKIKERDLYNFKNSTVVADIVKQCMLLPESKESETELMDVMKVYQEDGCFVRALRFADVLAELHIIEENEKVLREHKLPNVAAIRDYMAKQSSQAKVKTPPGFVWRPQTFVAKNIPVKLYGGNIAVIIDPREEAGTLPAYFYKWNANSINAAKGSFIYESKRGSLKDKANIEKMKKKILEMVMRGRGEIEDRSLHYFGKDKLSWNEVLGTYSKKGIAGIVIDENAAAAQEALLLRARLGKPSRPFYRYTAELGMVPLTDAEVIKQSEICLSMVSDKTAERIKSLNESIKTATSISELISITTPIAETVILNPETADEQHYKGLKRTLSFQLTGDREKDERMLDLLQKIKNEFHFYDESDVIINHLEVERHESSISITFKLIDIPDTQQFQQIFMNNLLSKVENLILNKESKSSLEDERKCAELLAKLDIEKITPRTVSTPLTKSQRLVFAFEHPEFKGVQCEAQVKDGKSQIEFRLQEGRKISAPTDKLQLIARKYYYEQSHAINTLLCDPAVVLYLKEHGIHDFKMKLIRKIGNETLMVNHEKNYFALEFNLASDTNLDDAKKVLANLLDFRDLTKVKERHSRYSFFVENGRGIAELETYQHPSTNVSLTTPDIQNIDYSIVKLSNFIKSARESALRAGKA